MPRVGMGEAARHGPGPQREATYPSSDPGRRGTRACPVHVPVLLSLMVAGLFAAGCAPATKTDPAPQAIGVSDIPDNAWVGDLGDPARLQFEGVQTFTPESIRRGLMANPDFLLASHPVAPLRDYLDAVRAHTLVGYRHGGFPLATAGASLDVPVTPATARTGSRSAPAFAGARGRLGSRRSSVLASSWPRRCS